MSKHDELDHLISNKLLTVEEMKSINEIIKVENLEDNYETILKEPSNSDNLFKSVREDFNMEIRHNYGHLFMKIFRNNYEPDYIDIVKCVAKKLKINIKKHHNVEDIEDKILVEIFELFKQNFIDEKGQDEWNKFEEELNNDFQETIRKSQLSTDDKSELLKYAMHGGIFAALIAGKIAGFALYVLANQVFFAISRALGLGIGVAVAGPLIGKSLSLILGPVGWLIAGISVAFALGDTNWKKTIPTIVSIIMIKRRVINNDEVAQL